MDGAAGSGDEVVEAAADEVVVAAARKEPRVREQGRGGPNHAAGAAAPWRVEAEGRFTSAAERRAIFLSIGIAHCSLSIGFHSAVAAERARSASDDHGHGSAGRYGA